jgi:hypothetical protein
MQTTTLDTRPPETGSSAADARAVAPIAPWTLGGDPGVERLAGLIRMVALVALLVAVLVLA